jgi:tetratricopeptide (TPR) repeat protein
LELTNDGNFIREIGPPKSDVLRADFKFLPMKLAVDSAKRLFVVSKGNFEGIVEFDAAGNFTGFFGKNRVTFNATDFFWKQIATETQRKQMELYIPIEFNNLDIDKEGFVYATASDNRKSSDMVKRLNPSGADVLRRDGKFGPVGDMIQFYKTSISGSSTMVAIAVNDDGIYSVLDSKRGRIFTYDDDGNLLFQFGQLGDKIGTFRTPVEVEWSGRNMLVLDKGMNRITVFEPTRYGDVLLDAATYYYHGKEEEATKMWQEALKLNNNLELAYLGIGKSYLEQGKYKEAMQSFEIAQDRGYYSKAFERYRKSVMWNHFTLITLVLVALIATAIIVRRFIPKKSPDDYGVVQNAIYLTVRPFKMFWELKYEGKGRIWLSLTIVGSVCFVYILKGLYTGFIVSGNRAVSMNIIIEIAYILVPFFVWCLANWSLTTLMDGEGKFKEIVLVSGYAMTPLVLIHFPLLVLSWVITTQEVAFYMLFDSIAMLWFLGLLFAGTLTVHQYTVTKTVITMALSIFVIGIIIFLALLFFSLVQQLVTLFLTLYQEISLRM